MLSQESHKKDSSPPILEPTEQEIIKFAKTQPEYAVIVGRLKAQRALANDPIDLFEQKRRKPTGGEYVMNVAPDGTVAHGGVTAPNVITFICRRAKCLMFRIDRGTFDACEFATAALLRAANHSEIYFVDDVGIVDKCPELYATLNRAINARSCTRR